jgi:hypothetical protein
MQVIVSATSSKVDDLILIETTTTIGDQVTSHRTGYGADELMENRFLSGDLETRIEALRLGAEAHFKTLMKVLQKEPEVTEVTGKRADVLILDEVPQEPAKKTRAKRQVKPTESI